jgi:hypothetical protein
MNGTNMNGTNMNGTNMNGTNMNGISLSGVVLGNLTLTNVHLDGSMLVAQHNGHTIHGSNLVGSLFSGVLDNGKTIELRIDHVSQGASPNTDIYYYSVSYQHIDGSWASLCADSSGNPLKAIPLAGTWDYSQGTATGGSHTSDSTKFTFACQHGALAKCTEWGYKPWVSVGGVNLADDHQTCTRTVRADYCGDGTSHTQNGQIIDIYDSVGVQTDTQSWIVEAEWDTNGSRCFNPANRSHFDILSTLPCYQPRLDVTCGDPSHFQSGTLIMTKTPLSSDTGISYTSSPLFNDLETTLVQTDPVELLGL